MKEKIKKAFEGVTLDLVIAWAFVALSVFVFIECICQSSYVGTIIVPPFLLVAVQAFELNKIRKELRIAKHVAGIAALAGMHVSDELERYKQLYGELPEEEPKEEIKEEQP